MSIFYTNKTITMNRGDSGVVLLSILNRDDTPFALPIGMKNPTVVFSVKAETDTNDLNGNMLIEEYMPIEDYTYYGYGTQNADGQMRIHGGFYPKSKTVNTEESVLDTGIIYKVLANKKYMFVVPTTTPPEYPIGLTKREYAFAVPLVFEPAFTDRLSPGTYTYSITLLDSTSPIRRTEGEGDNAITVTDFDGFLKNVTLKQDLFGSQKLILSDSPIARVHGEPIRRIYYIQPCSEASVANATANEITTGNVTSIALPPVYIATAEQLGGVIVGETLQVDFRGVLNVSKTITDKIADLYSKIGDMTTLTTDEKTTLVGAINEVDEHADANKTEIGDLSTLTTDEKTTLVGAINEVDAHANTGISKADAAQVTADNATTLANTGISKADRAQSTADNAQQDAETAQATADNATTLANTGIGKAEHAQVTADGAVDQAVSALDRANKAYEKASDNVYAVGFMTLEEAITALNGYDNTVLKTNDNIIVVAQGSPDLYVTGVESTSIPYHFTTVDKFNDDLVKNTVLQIGYYKVAFYETNGQPVTVAYQNVVVNNWVASTEFADFPYEAKIELTDFVDYTTVPQVVFDIADTMSGNYAPICKSGDKCVYIYGKVQNEITLKTVITFAPNVNGASVVGGGYNNRGKWVASTSYAIDDLVYTDKGQYVCIEAITSTTSPDNDTTHWQASFVATAGTTENVLNFVGRNKNDTNVLMAFDGSMEQYVSFDKDTFIVEKTSDDVLEIRVKGTVPEALPQTASALKSGNLPTTGWTNVTAPLWQGVATFDKNSGNKTLLCNIGVKWNNRDEMPLTGWVIEYSYIGNDNRYTITTLRKDDSVSKNGIFYGFGSGGSYPYLEIDVNGDVYGWTLYTYISGRTIYKIEQQSLSKQGYTISDTSITANSDILMELTDDGGVKAYSMEAGKMTVIRDTVPTQPIPYTYKVKQTNASGQFTLVNHFVPNVPRKTSELTNDSGFITESDIPTIPTSLPVTYKKASGSLPTSGWTDGDYVTYWTGTVSVSGWEYYKKLFQNSSIYSDVVNDIKLVATRGGSTSRLYNHGIKTLGSPLITGYVFTSGSSYDRDSAKIIITEDGNVYGTGSYSAGSSNSETWRMVGKYEIKSKLYTISDTDITANTSVKMYLTDEGGVKAYSKAVGSIQVIRDSVPTTAIPYEYEVEQTSAEGLFEVINAYVPSVPTKTSDLTNDSGFVTSADVPTKTSDLTNDSGFLTKNNIVAGDNVTVTDENGNVKISATGGDSGGVTYTKLTGSVDFTVTSYTNDPYFLGQDAATWSENSAFGNKALTSTTDIGLFIGNSYNMTVNISGTSSMFSAKAEDGNTYGLQGSKVLWFKRDDISSQFFIYDHCTIVGENIVAGDGCIFVADLGSDITIASINYFSGDRGAITPVTITNSAIKINSAVTMYINSSLVVSGTKTDGSITLTASTKGSVSYEMEIFNTSIEGLFEVINAYVPDVPTKTSQLTNDSGFITAADIPGVGEWVSVTAESTTLTQAGTYQFVTTVDKAQSIMYWDGTTAAIGTPMVGLIVNADLPEVITITPRVAADGRLIIHQSRLVKENNVWVVKGSAISTGFKYRKIN